MIGVDTYGFKIPTEEFDKELHFACEDGFVKNEQATLSKGLTLYRLTAAGRDYLEGNGLV